MGSGAAFISAGGYHHHIGLNTWESKGGSPPPPGTTGLFHAAILYPTRAALADALHRVIQAGIQLDGASDHGVSEALYLRDPDENGVELYRDRRRRGMAARCRTARSRCSRGGWIWTICCVPAKHDQHRRRQLQRDADVERQRVAAGRIPQQPDHAGPERVGDLVDRGDQADQHAERARVEFALHDQRRQRDQIADREAEHRAGRDQHDVTLHD